MLLCQGQNALPCRLFPHPHTANTSNRLWATARIHRRPVHHSSFLLPLLRQCCPVLFHLAHGLTGNRPARHDIPHRQSSPRPVVLASTVLVISEAPDGETEPPGPGDDEVGARQGGRQRERIRARREAPASRPLALGATVRGLHRSAGERRTAGHLAFARGVAEFLTGEAHGELRRWGGGGGTGTHKPCAATRPTSAVSYSIRTNIFLDKTKILHV